jgi:hypothetical protein
MPPPPDRLGVYIRNRAAPETPRKPHSARFRELRDYPRSGVLYSGSAGRCLEWDMPSEQLYRLLDPEPSGAGARVLRGLFMRLLVAGIGIMFANTEPTWR